MARKTLKELLLSYKGVEPSVADEVIKTQSENGQNLYQAMLSVFGEEQQEFTAAVMSDISGCPFINLQKYSISEEMMQDVSPAVCRSLGIVPVSCLRNMSTVAMADPLNVASQDWIRETTGKEIAVMVATASSIAHAIEHIGEEAEEAEPEIEDSAEAGKPRDSESLESLVEKMSAAGSGERSAGRTVNENEIMELVDSILFTAMKHNASDIHMEPYENIFRLRYRQDGKLRVICSPPIGLYAAICSRIKIMSDLNIAEHRIPQDGRMKAKKEDREIDFRVSILPTYHGEKVVMRILDSKGLSLDFKTLGFSDEQEEMFKDAVREPNGIVLVTGPTGSGKTTTLYSALSFINNEDVNIITLEDPVEYDLFAINQVQANAKVGLTFASGLRSILRQDPDVVMVGEIRDAETAEIAIKAALTGHLVLSTLHTNDAIGAVYRLLDMGAEPFMLAASLNLTQAQRLVRKLCEDCKEPVSVPEKVLEDIQRVSGRKSPEIFKPRGCARCAGTGYKGRTSIIEIVPITADMKDMISASAPQGELKKLAKDQGFMSLYEAGLKCVADRKTSLEEAMGVTVAG